MNDFFSRFLIIFFLSILSIGRYPLNLKLCPFNPEDISAINIDEGPIKGTTLIPFLCASLTTSAPGSAIPGHPASEIKAISDLFKHGFKILFNSNEEVCLFNKEIFSSDCFFFGEIFLMNALPGFSFSKMKKLILLINEI